MHKILAAVLLSGWLTGVLTGAELTNEEKLTIIDEIIAQKIKEGKGASKLSDALDAVSEKMGLDVEETPKTIEIIERLKQKTKNAFPDSDCVLTKKYRPIAEAKYPIYKYGDKVKVIFLLHGKPFYVSGPYYKSSFLYVWVGSHKILRWTLSPSDAYKFDASKGQAKRDQYIREKVNSYHRKSNDYLRKLLVEQKDSIEFSCNKLKVGEKWLSTRSVVEQKFKEAVDLQNREIFRRVQLSKQYKSISNLEYLIGQYPNHPDKNEWMDLLISYKIQMKIQMVKNTESYQQKFHILESLIGRYPNHPDKNKWVDLLISYKIQMAKDTESYQQKFHILKSVIRDYPNHETCRNAEALLKQYNGEYLRRIVWGIVLIIGICVVLVGLFIIFYLKRDRSTIKECLKNKRT